MIFMHILLKNKPKYIFNLLKKDVEKELNNVFLMIV